MKHLRMKKYLKLKNTLEVFTIRLDPEEEKNISELNIVKSN